MVTEITVSGRTVKLKATAAVPRLYRIKFRRDMIHDFRLVDQAIKKQQQDKANGEDVDLPVEALWLFEHMAYMMAKHGDPEGVPDREEDWLDQFDTFDIYRIFPVIAALWEGNTESLLEAKKKLTQPIGS